MALGSPITKGDHNMTTTTTTVKPATSKQLAFLIDLLKSRPGPVADGVLAEIYANSARHDGTLFVSSVEASRWIDALTRVRPPSSTPPVPHPTVPAVGPTAPVVIPPPAPPTPVIAPVPVAQPPGKVAGTLPESSRRTNAVPDGSYALIIDGVVKSYFVHTETEGDWAGFCSVSLYVSDNQRPLKGRERHQVLDLLVEDPRSAAILYGREHKICPRCHRKLTLKRSKDAGIGPKCAEEWGWAY